MARTLYGLGHFALVLHRSAGDASGQNFALLVHQFQQKVRVLVVDVLNAVLAKPAVLRLLGINLNRGKISDF